MHPDCCKTNSDFSFDTPNKKVLALGTIKKIKRYATRLPPPPHLPKQVKIKLLICFVTGLGEFWAKRNHTRKFSMYIY
jgi:hypothetical protein